MGKDRRVTPTIQGYSPREMQMSAHVISTLEADIPLPTPPSMFAYQRRTVAFKKSDSGLGWLEWGALLASYLSCTTTLPLARPVSM